MRVLVTGGAGFIGSHLCESLLRDGHDVIVLDELNDFYSPLLKRENLEEISRIAPIVFQQGDIRDSETVHDLMSRTRPQAVIHLAARAGVRPSLEQPLLYEQVNVRGTLVMLEASRNFGVGKFVFASSSSIYGIANRVPFSELDPANLPVSPYAATKIAGEKLGYTYSHLYGIDVVCLRFFTVYGPRQRPDLAIRKFAEAIEAGRRIPVFGDGSSSRDYTYVDDVVKGVLAALQSPIRYDIFNLGNSRPVSLLAMIHGLEAQIGRRAEIDWLPDQPGDVPITYADINKARSVLGYCPSTPFETGLECFVRWLRDRSRR
jgi:UDP-glucuronate 4-epimerase